MFAKPEIMSNSFENWTIFNHKIKKKPSFTGKLALHVYKLVIIPRYLISSSLTRHISASGQYLQICNMHYGLLHYFFYSQSGLIFYQLIQYCFTPQIPRKIEPMTVALVTLEVRHSYTHSARSNQQ